jgi:hypothetical protein
MRKWVPRLLRFRRTATRRPKTVEDKITSLYLLAPRPVSLWTLMV